MPHLRLLYHAQANEGSANVDKNARAKNFWSKISPNASMQSDSSKEEDEDEIQHKKKRKKSVKGSKSQKIKQVKRIQTNSFFQDLL